VTYQRGFTLVEMLVSLSVASLLIGLVYGTVRIGQRSAAAIDHRVEDAEVMRIGWEFLQDAVRRARPMPDPSLDDEPTSFDGNRDRLSFVADMPAYVGLGGLMRIGLAPDTTAEGDRLIVTRERFDVTGEAPEPAPDSVQSAVLVDRLERLTITYFGQRPEDDLADWHDTWQELPAIPNLVRIEIVPEGSPAWPVLIASPSTGAPALTEDDLLLDDLEREDAVQPDSHTPENPDMPGGH
jgi:general secretion pathway protein J